MSLGTLNIVCLVLKYVLCENIVHYVSNVKKKACCTQPWQTFVKSVCQGSAQNKVVGSSFIPCCNLEGSFNPVTFLRQLMWFFFGFPVYSSILMLLLMFENFIYYIVIIGLYSDLHHHPRTLTSTFIYNQLPSNKQTEIRKF